MSGFLFGGYSSTTYPAPLLEDLVDAIQLAPSVACDCGAPAVFESTGEGHCLACASREDDGRGIIVRRYFRDHNGVLCVMPPWFMFRSRYGSERDIRRHNAGSPLVHHVPGGVVRMCGGAQAAAWETVAEETTVFGGGQ